MLTRLLCALLLLASVTLPSARARIWYVSEDGTGDAATIQAAFDSSAAFDTVMVGPGIFHEHDILCTPYVYLVSEFGPDSSTVDATGGLEGFVSPAAHAPQEISGLTIVNAEGAGISTDHGTLAVRWCIIRDCGVGIYARYSTALFTNITVIGSSTDSYSGSGFSLRSGDPAIRNCIIAYNEGYGIVDWGAGGVEVECCCVFANEQGNYEGTDLTGISGNISEDPQFCDFYGGDLHLADISPCVPYTPPNPTCDLIGGAEVGCTTLIVEPDGSGDFPTIQAAIDAAAEGEHVLLRPGTFRGEGNRDIDFRGKTVQVVGAWDETAASVIDCEHLGRGFIFASGEGQGAVLSGVTIINGLAAQGGGIHCADSSPRLQFCTVAENHALVTGAGLCCQGSSTPTIRFCTFARNWAPCGSGLTSMDGADPLLQNTIIAFGTIGEAIACDAQSSALLTCSDVFGNEGGDWVGCIADQYGVAGNFSLDPLFCDDANPERPYTVTSRSPCLPGHDVDCGQIGAWAQGCYGAVHVHPDGSGDFPTIQAAIDGVGGGETVELTDGVYSGDGNRNLDFHGKSITVRSDEGNPETCIIDCEGVARGFVFQSGEGSASAIEGIAVVNGSAYYGGAIRLTEGSSPSIRNCWFTDNAGSVGGAVYCNDCSPAWDRCTFEGNTATIGGALLCQTGAHPEFTYCTFSHNSAATEGGAILSRYATIVDLTNCTFAENSAEFGSGIYCDAQSDPVLANCILAFGATGSAIYCAGPTDPALTCCDIYGNEGGDWVGCIADQYGVSGNISEDPLFCGASYPEEPWRLQEDSPCAPYSPPNPECDLIGAWEVGCDPMSAEDGRIAPAAMFLLPSRPNPAHSPAQITYGVPAGAQQDRVSLRIYDAAGRLVRTLVDRSQCRGRYTVTWDGIDEGGKPVATGVYFYQLQLGRERAARRLVLIK